MSYKRHSFSYTTSGQRRGSVVIGSLGRTGIFSPGDFMDLPNTSALSIESQQNLLTDSASRRLLDEEAQLLNENGIPTMGSYLLTARSASPLQSPSLVAAEGISQAWESAVENHKITHSSYSLELKNLVFSSLPLILTFVLENSMSVLSIFSVGHLGSRELLAVSLGAMTLNITLYSIIHGLATSLDTLCSQLYGLQNYKLVGVYFQKCSLLIFAVFIPIFIFYWTRGNWLLSKMIPDLESAKLLSDYLNVVSLGVPGYILFETGKRFLQSQGIFHASTYVLCVCAPLNALMNYLFVWNKYIGIGYLGAPILVLINYWLMLTGLFVYTINTKSEINPMKCWRPIDVHSCLSGWGTLFHLALPGVIMIELEFIAFELLTLLSSYLGTDYLALQSIVTTMLSLTYQVPFAISIASGTRVANLLGASLTPLLRVHSKVAILFSIGISMINCSLLFFGDNVISSFFTNDPVTIAIVSTIIPFVAVIQIFDSLNLVSAGLLRGQGLQKIGGIVNLISYYLIGLPVLVLLTFKYGLGLKGLWLGTGLLLLIIGVVQSYFVINADYDQLVKDLEIRNRG